MLVDDTHWADLPSLRWSSYVGRSLDGIPVALVLAGRPAEGGPGQALLDELLAAPDIGVLHPVGLSEPAVAQLAARTLTGEPDAGVRRRVPPRDRR